MSKSHEQLSALADKLEHGGDDKERVEIVRRAQRFKRSWVELAEGLVALRSSRAYERWGYASLHEYCGKELHLKAATVDKLMLSFNALRKHAPEVLRRDGVSREIPTMDAVGYFARAFGENDAHDAPKALIAELREAVFEEGCSASELRKRFEPVLHPRNARQERAEGYKRIKALAERLASSVQGVDGLPEARVARVVAIVEALVRDLDALIEKSEKPGKGRAA